MKALDAREPSFRQFVCAVRLLEAVSLATGNGLRERELLGIMEDEFTAAFGDMAGMLSEGSAKTLWAVAQGRRKDIPRRGRSPAPPSGTDPRRNRA